MLLLLGALAGLASTQPGHLTLDRSAIESRIASGRPVAETLAELHRLSWQACRARNRHGAMAARSTRICTRDTLDRAVNQLDIPDLSAAHGTDRGAEALHHAGRNCDNTGIVSPADAGSHDDRSDP